MATSPVFEWASVELERESGMTRLQARGTLRLALNEFGLDVETLTAHQLRVVAAKVLGPALRSRAIADPDKVCAALAKVPSEVDAAQRQGRPAPEDVFKRLGRS